MMERGISVRCMVTWSVWSVAILTGIVAGWTGRELIGIAAAVGAAGGMMMVILNDNARTRQAIRVAMRADRDYAGLTRVP